MSTVQIANPIPAVFQKLDPISYLLGRKGQIVTITAIRSMKTRKGILSKILKRSTFQAQVGVNYDNKASVKEKRESGELPAENAGLPWGQWEIFPYVIEHNGKRYFRFSTVKNNFQRQVSYFLDGKEVSKDLIESLCLASEFREKESLDTFTFPIEGIESIG
jgi:hypothetical protein